MNEYPAKLNTGYYRVRTDWDDDASQLGAYKLLANAKAKCDENPGSYVFAEDGTVIYPADEPTTREENAEEKPVTDTRKRTSPAMMHPAVPKRTSRPQSRSRMPLLSVS